MPRLSYGVRSMMTGNGRSSSAAGVARTNDIRRQPDTVAHRHHDVAIDSEFDIRRYVIHGRHDPSLPGAAAAQKLMPTAIASSTIAITI